MKQAFLRQVYSLVVLLLLVCNVAAQTLTLQGVVRDSQSHAPLAGASVMVEGSARYSSTDAKGRYRLSLSREPHTVLFGYMGFSPRKIEIRPSDSIMIYRDIYLDSAFMGIDAVYVGSKGTAKLVRESAPPVAVISADQLQGSISNVEDILYRMAGVTLRSTGGVGSSTRISVRGLEGKRIALFMDETPVSQHSDFVSLNDIPLDLIDRIEVYKGVVPFNLGGAALGGAINVVLKDFPPRYHDFSYEYGRYNLHRLSLVNKINDEAHGVLYGFGGGATYADNDYEMDVPSVKGLRVRRDHDRFLSILFGGSAKLSRTWFDEVEIEPAGTYMRREMQGIYTDIRKATTSSAMGLLNLKLEKESIGAIPLGFEWRGMGGYAQSRFIDTARYRHKWDGSRYLSPGTGGGEIGEFLSSTTTGRGIFNSNLFLNYFLTPNHTLHASAYQDFLLLAPRDDLQEETMGFRTAYGSRMFSSVLALDYQYRSDGDVWLNALTGKYFYYAVNSQRYNWLAGKREDVFTRQHDWGVSDALRYRVTHDLMLKASAAYSSRLPAENELVGNGLEISPAVNLRPERNLALNLGLMYNHRFSENQYLELEVNGFYNHLTDMIRLSKGFVLAQYENFGKARILGAEVEVKGDILSWLYGYVNCTYQDQRDRREKDDTGFSDNPTYNLRVPNLPYLMGNAGLEFHRANLFGGKGQNTRLNVDGTYIHEYFYDFEISALQTRRIPTTLSFDASLEHSIMDKTWTFTAKFYNLTNQKLFTEFNRPLPGFRFALKVRYLFK